MRIKQPLQGTVTCFVDCAPLHRAWEYLYSKKAIGVIRDMKVENKIHDWYLLGLTGIYENVWTQLLRPELERYMDIIREERFEDKPGYLRVTVKERSCTE